MGEKLLSSFELNGILWKVVFVKSTDEVLIDRTGMLRVATTDPVTHRVYLSDRLHGDFLNKVFIHELGHCVMFSFNLIEKIHSMTNPAYWIDMEEFICNFISDYGYGIFSITSRILGDQAWIYIPSELTRLVS